MRATLLFLFTFLIAGLAEAQPIITSASEAVPGDAMIYRSTQLLGVAMPVAGANVTWDYSGLTDSGSIEVDSFKSPLATPYAAVFPGTSLALPTAGGAYLYYSTTSSAWSILGFISPGADTAYYLSTLNEFHFPFTYGNTSLDSTKEVTHLTGFKDTSEIIVAQQATGYGTLKVPGQTYSNVLMVKKTTTTRSTFNTSIQSSYIFVTPGSHSFLMQMNLDGQNDFNDIKYVFNGTVVIPTSYTFNGNGDWTNAANWSGSAVPISPVPSGTTVTISPQAGGSCTLDVPMIFASGSTLTVSTKAIFKVMGNLTILK